MKYSSTQQFWIDHLPTPRTKVACKTGEATAYLYTSANGKPAAAIFFGKQGKPYSRVYYSNEAAREADIKKAFAAATRHAVNKAGERLERKTAGAGLIEGDILSSSWGYDQTNVDFYQVTRVINKQVELRKIGAIDVPGGHGIDSARCKPAVGHFIGQTIKRLARNGTVRINSVCSAYKVDDVEKSHYYSWGH